MRLTKTKGLLEIERELFKLVNSAVSLFDWMWKWAKFGLKWDSGLFGLSSYLVRWWCCGQDREG